MDDIQQAIEDHEQALSRVARLAWVMEHHVAWGWQQEDPRRLTETRASDSGYVVRWRKQLLQDVTSSSAKLNRQVDKKLSRLEAREDRLSPHNSPKPALDLNDIPKQRVNRCPSCGTNLRVGGGF